VQITARQEVLRHADGQPFHAVTMLSAVALPARRQAWLKLTPSTDPTKPEAFWLRWQMNAGLIFAHLDYAEILANILGTPPPEVEVEIYCSNEDRPNPSPQTWLNRSPGGMRAAGAGSIPSFQRLHTWPMYGTPWKLFFYTTGQFDRVSTRHRALWAAVLGLITTALICALLTVQIRARLAEATRAAELSEARDALQAAQRQRERLSHDLHDGAIQSLYAIQLGLTGVEGEVEDIKPRTAERLAEGRASLDVVIGELREFITEMQVQTRVPPASLAEVLQSLVRRMQSASQAAIDLKCDAAASERLTPNQAVQLAAIAREALSNSLRHARPHSIRIHLTNLDGKIVLEVADDGSGFDPHSTGEPGLGLSSIRRRADEIQAELEIRSSPGAGTSVTCKVQALPTPERDSA